MSFQRNFFYYFSKKEKLDPFWDASSYIIYPLWGVGESVCVCGGGGGGGWLHGRWL